MKFDVLTDEQLAEQRSYLTPGNADFEVIEAMETVSKSSGNPMTVLTLKVCDVKDKVGMIKDYIPAGMSFKIKHLFDSVGCADAYQKGEVDADFFIGREGVVNLYMRKDKTGQYPDRITVKDYVPAEPKTQAVSNDFDDDIPF